VTRNAIGRLCRYAVTLLHWVCTLKQRLIGQVETLLGGAWTITSRQGGRGRSPKPSIVTQVINGRRVTVQRRRMPFQIFVGN